MLIRISRNITISNITDFEVGDKIQISPGRYATCQSIRGDKAVFLEDMCLEERYPMNNLTDNTGGYSKSDLRKRINEDRIIHQFDALRYRMVPFENGDLLRIPYTEEIVGHINSYNVSSSGTGQWSIMEENIKERISHNKFNVFLPYWTQNPTTSGMFAIIDTKGMMDSTIASNNIGVRLLFQLKM